MQRSTHPDTGSSPQPCGVGRRLLAMTYDTLIVLALVFLAGLAALPLTGGEQRVLRDPALTAWIVGVWFVYLAWCWTHGGQTVGLRAWRTRLHTVGGGGRPTWRACLVRFAVSLLSAAALGAGYWWAWTNAERATWHDLASGTRLLRLKKTRASGSDRSPEHVNDPESEQQ